MGAENTVTSRDLRIFVDQAAKPVASPDAEVVVGRCDVSPADGWFLAEGPVRPAGVVVIDVFAEDVVQVSSAGDEDPAGALAPRTADPVGLEYTITAMTCVFSWRRVVCQAAIWYSWVSPPRTCFRRIRCSARLIGSGGWVSACSGAS